MKNRRSKSRIIFHPHTFKQKMLMCFIMLLVCMIIAAEAFAPIKEVLLSKMFDMEVGGTHVSAYKILQAMLVFGGMFYMASSLSHFAQDRVMRLKHHQHGGVILLIRITQILLYGVAVIVSINMLGIPVSAMTFFSGAVGVGIAFSLQKIASNFVSGAILLFEDTMKEGDLIELSGVSGCLRYIGSRFTVIETFEGRSVMVPNEYFITKHVTNWTQLDKRGRIDIKSGFPYGCDLEKAIEIVMQVAASHPACMKDPGPSCYIRRFEESSIRFSLRLWVEDISEHMMCVRSEVMVDMHKKLGENGILIPHQQVDLHVKGLAPKELFDGVVESAEDTWSQ